LLGCWFQGVDHRLPGVDPAQYGNSVLKWQYIGLQSVPMRAIYGSEKGSDAFDAAFRPLAKASRDHWLATLIELVDRQDVQPVEVIKIDNGYFVQNGLYRVSVARWMGSKAFPAYVTEWALSLERSNGDFELEAAQVAIWPPPETITRRLTFFKAIYRRLYQRVIPGSRKEVAAVRYQTYWANSLVKMKWVCFISVECQT
jgi:hypothetical protein